MKPDADMMSGIMIAQEEKFIYDLFGKKFFRKWFDNICQYFLRCFCAAIYFCIEPLGTDGEKSVDGFFFYRFRKYYAVICSVRLFSAECKNEFICVMPIRTFDPTTP